MTRQPRARVPVYRWLEVDGAMHACEQRRTYVGEVKYDPTCGKAEPGEYARDDSEEKRLWCLRCSRKLQSAVPPGPATS